MEQIESVDDLKKALKVDDLRQMSSEKVLTLVQLIQKGQISSGVLSALLSTAPNTMASLAQAMDNSVQNAATSNDKGSLHKLHKIQMRVKMRDEMLSTALNGMTTSFSNTI